MSAAIRQFSKHGLHGVSVRTIANEADANLSLISQYFGGKQQLYLRCIESIYAALQNTIPEFTKRLDEEPRLAIHYAVNAAIEMGQRNRDALLLTMRHFIEHGQMEQARRDKVLIPTIAIVTHHLEPYSDLDQDELRLAVLSAIMLVGRLVALSGDDLGAILTASTDTKGFKHDLTTMLIRLLALKETSTNH
ncbi:MAG: TetR family transcriptional regulator [Bradymonadia bacterium]